MASPVFLLKRESVLSLVIASVVQVLSQSAFATPEGGQVAAGQGVIEQAGKETRIQQASERLSIDWKSFDINSDERVQFIQPNSSSIAFNRISSNKGSLIQGRIDANGQVVLINPNGLIFTEGASVNAGGLIASALQMNDQDYLNGRFTLNALEGSEGRVINSGLLNAATGGNISLIGQSIENKGLISAQLGSVNLAAGKEAVLTFESNGLVGVRVTEAVLQKDLGVDAAVINSGEVKAEGGKVLITASTSKDIFSKAVNVGELSAARSAVVNDDGSFTLGAGADIKNTGSVSVAAEGNAGEAVVIGENITNQGQISADSTVGSAGKIEITAKSINENKQSGSVTAVALQQGLGGDIKLLGDKVGLLGKAKIDVSGANGGGQALIGGDQQGQNNQIQNAEFVYVDENSQIHADGLVNGNGGTAIFFAQDTTRIFGKISSMGGESGGYGGFVETSGLQGFEISEAPRVAAKLGNSGTWLIDPYNISIGTTGNTSLGGNTSDFFANKSNATILVSSIQSAIKDGANIIIQTSKANEDAGTQVGNITLASDLVLNGATGAKLTLNAHNNIDTRGRKISVGGNSLNFELNADFDGNDTGAVLLGSSDVSTGGGSFRIKAGQNNIVNGVIINSAVEMGGASINTGAGQLILDAAGDINLAKDGGVSTLTTTGASIEINNANANSPRGAVLLGGSTLSTAGGNLVINSGNNSGDSSSVSAKDAILNTSANNGAGDITIDAKGDVVLGEINLSRTFNVDAVRGGSLKIVSQGDVSLVQEINFNDFSVYKGLNSNNDKMALPPGISATLPNAQVNPDSVTSFDISAAGSIDFKGKIYDQWGDGRDSLNIIARADHEVMNGGKDNSGSVIIGNSIFTSGGTVNFSGAEIKFENGGLLNTDRANENESGNTVTVDGNGNATRSDGGDIILASDKDIILGDITTDHFCTLGTCSGNLTIQNRSTNKSISITQADNATLSVHGSTTLISNGGAITLDKTENLFGTQGAQNNTNSNSDNISDLVTSARGSLPKTVSANAQGSISGGAVSLTDDNTLLFGSIKADKLSVDTTGDLRQIANAGIEANSLSLIGKSILLPNNENKYTSVTLLDSKETASIATTQNIALETLKLGANQLTLSLVKGNSATFNGAVSGGAGNSTVIVTAAPLGSNGIFTAKIADGLSKAGTGALTFADFSQLQYVGSNNATWDLNAKTLGFSNKLFNYNDAVTAVLGGNSGNIFKTKGPLRSLPTLTGGAGTDEVNLDVENGNNPWQVNLFANSESFATASLGLVQAKSVDKIQVLNNGASTNTQLKVIAPAWESTWELTSDTQFFTLKYTGVSSGSIEFSGFKQLIGGSGKDTFDYSGGGTVFAGNVDGAGGSEDTINGFNDNASWDLTGPTANFYRTSVPTQKYNFAGIEKLIGGNQKDVVTLASNITKVDLDSFSTGFSLESFEGITATAPSATLTGYDGNSNWTITGKNSGTIVSGSKSTVFAGFETLVGELDYVDVFNISTGTDLSGNTTIGSITSITGQAGDTLNTRSGASVTNDWVIDPSGNAQVAEKNGATSTVYINKISGVGTVNGSIGADNFIAQGTYKEKIDARPGNDLSDINNTLTTKNVDILFSDTDFTANGIIGITKFNADGATSEIKASADAGAVNWAVTPGEAAGQLSGTVVGVAANKSLDFKNFAKLTGGNNSDEFTLGAGTFSGGTIDGGAINNGGGANSLINTTPGAVWDLAANTLRTVNFANIQTLNAFTDDSLKAANASNSFTLDATSARLVSTDTNNFATRYTLKNFKTLIGGDNLDAFKIDINAADVEFQGGKGNDTFTLASDLIKTKNLIGGEDSDTVSVSTTSVSTGANVWTLSAANTGDVNANTFSGMEILGGGTGADTFKNEIAGQTLTLSAIDSGVLRATGNDNSIAIKLEGMERVQNLAELKGFDDTTAWALNTDGVGTVKTAGNATLNFTEVTQLIGGTGNETFTIDKAVTKFKIDGGAGVNTVQGPESVNTWKLSGQTAGAANQPVANKGTLNSTGEFTNIQKLLGTATLADTLDLTGSSGLTAALANISGFDSLIGGTNSTLAGADQTNTWSLVAGDGNKVNSTAFKGFNTLTGGNGLDTFVISNGAQFSGVISGGVLNDPAVRDEIQMDGVKGTFIVDSQGAGSLEYSNPTGDIKVSFTDIEALIGGTAADKFTVKADVDMVLDGGKELSQAIDEIELPDIKLDINLSAGGALPQVNKLTLTNFESITAGATSENSLGVTSGDASWDISGKYAGTVTFKNGSTTKFANFANLVSGPGTDNFFLGANGVITSIAANGDDTLTGRDASTRWNLTSSLQLTDTVNAQVYAQTVTGLKNWQGGAGDDIFDLSAPTANPGSINIFGGKGLNQLNGPSGNWGWALTGSQKGNISLGLQAISFEAVNSLMAGANQELTNTNAVAAWNIDVPNQLIAHIGVDSTLLNNFAVVNTGSAAADNLSINSAYTGTINLQSGENNVTLGAAGSISSLSAGGSADVITSEYGESLWTQTEEASKRVNVFTGNNSVIGALTGFDKIIVDNSAGAHRLATSLNANNWTIANATSGTLNGIEFSGFKNLKGSAGKDTFKFINGGKFGGEIDGGDGENLVNVATGSQTKYELNDAQSSEINGVQKATGVIGAGGQAQLTLVSDENATWNIDEVYQGDLTFGPQSKKFSFEGFGVLVGGKGNDTFVFSAPTAKIDRIEGGAQLPNGVDTLKAKSNQVNLWTIGAGNSLDNTLASENGTAYLNDFDGIETITGAGQDKLVIAAGSTQWDLNKNSGRLINTPAVTGVSSLALNFTGLNSLRGSDGKDTYNLVEVPEFAVIDGGGGDNLVQLAAQDAVLDLTQGFAVQGVKNVTGVTGSGVSASLKLVANGDATWNLLGKNTGTISVQGRSIAFDNFINLTGGSNNDAFILDAKGFVTGAINGGVTSNGGQNSLAAWSSENANWILNTNSSVTSATNGFKQNFSGINVLNGSAKNDTFNVLSSQTLQINASLGDDTLKLDTNSRLDGRFNGGEGFNTVQTTDGQNTWQLNSATSGSVRTTGEAFSRADFFEVSSLVGGSGVDNLKSFDSAATWDVTKGEIATGAQGANKINFSEMDTLTGGSQSDLFTVSSAFAGDIFAGGASDTLELLANGSVKSFTGGGQGADAVGDKIIGPVAGAIWQLNAASNSLTTAGGVELVSNFQEVETLQADSAGDDTLKSTLAQNAWELSSANAGKINGFNFSGFDYLTGSDFKDTFVFNFIGTFGKGVDALKGDNTVQLNLVNRVVFDWSDKNVNGVNGANRIIGSNAADSELSLVSSTDLTWTLDRADGGAISVGSVGSTPFNFDQFKNIKGSAKADTMRFTDAGSISGSVNGGEGAGVDSLQGLDQENNWQLGQTLSVTRNGEASAYINNASGFESLVGGNSADVFTVTGRVKAGITGREGNDKLILGSTGSLDGSFAGNQGENAVESQLAASTWRLTSGSDVASISAGAIKNGDETALNFSEVQQFTALPGGDNELNFSAINFGLKWTIDGGANQRASGRVELTSDAAIRARFSGFNRISGAAAADEVTLSTALSELNLGAGDNRLNLLAGGGVSRLVAGVGSDELRSYAAANQWQMQGATEGTLSTSTTAVIGQFTGFEALTGTGTDKLTGAEGTNKWVLTAAGKGTLNGQTTFAGFADLVGNGGMDTFEFDPAGAMARVNGGDGADNLVARTSENQWSFTSNDRGSINAIGADAYVGFSGIEQFTGATLANDHITLAPQVTQVQLKAGGQAGDELIVQYRDNLSLKSDGSSWRGISGVKKVTAESRDGNRDAQLISEASSASLWTINEVDGGDWAVGNLTTHFSGFDKVQGSAAKDDFQLANTNARISRGIEGGSAPAGTVQNDSLAAAAVLTEWTITSSGVGSLTYFDRTNPPVQSFAGIETLLGNVGNDVFRLEADGININIRGGGGTGNDKVIFNGALDITLGQQDVVGVGIAEIEAFDADPSKQNTLRSSATGGAWTLKGINSGVLQSGSEMLSFSNFQNLIGGKGADVFSLDETAQVTGLLSGGGGDGENRLNLRHDLDLMASLTADGAGALSGTAAIARFEQINSLDLVALAPNLSATLTAANQPNQWVVTDNKVVLNGLQYTGFTHLVGQDGADDFVLNGKQTLSIDGKSGSDSLAINSAQGTLVNWQLTGPAGSVTAGAGNSVLIAPLFANIEQLFGGDGDDAFALRATGNRYSHVDGGAGDNSLASSEADGQWQLGALTGDGSPVVDRLNNAELVNIQALKGSGSDSLLGSDDNNLWRMGRGGLASLSQTNGTDIRNLETSGMARINGGKGQDDFVLQETGTGSFARMDGGEVGVDSVTGVNTSSVRDSLDAKALSADVQVNLNTIPNSTPIATNQLVVAGIETIQLNSDTTNTLYGPTLANKEAVNWQITQAKQGSLAPKLGAHGENTVTFSGVNNIIAGAGEDRFALTNQDGLGGDLDGGAGVDYLDYSQAALSANQSNFKVVIGDNARLKNIEGVIGKNTSAMQLVINGTSSQWLLDDIDKEGTTSDGVNDGRVTYRNALNQQYSVDFVDFAALVGTQGEDVFTITGGFNGSITTGEGVDRLEVSVNPARVQSIELTNDSSDSLKLKWLGTAPASVKETYKQASNGRESITLESLNPSAPLQPFAIDFTALASINDTLAVDEMRVQTAFESAGSNRLSLTQNALQLAIDSPSGAKVGTWFNVENKTNLVLSGQAGDQLSLSGTSQLAGALTLEKFAINALGEQSLGAGQITFSSVASIGSEQKPVVIATPLVQFNNLRGDAWVKSSGDIKLASIEGQGKLNLVADGQIGQTQLLTYARDLNLTASGAITLDNPDNRLTGGLSLQSANAIKLANGLTQINALSAENFTFSGQDLTAVGPMVVAGSTDLTSTGSISAVNPANRLARVQVNAAGSTNLTLGADSTLVGAKVAGALRVQGDGLEVAGDISAASLDLTAGQPTSGAGQLKISGQLNAPIIALTAGDLVLKTQLQAGQLSLNAKSVSLEKSINLTGDFSAQVDTLQQGAEAAIASKGALTINADGALQLNGALSSERGMAITAGGTIQQSGVWRTDLTAASGETKPASADVVVKSAGSIIQQASASTQSSGGITYEAAGEIRLSALSAKGEVFVNATGGIEDVNGTATNITAPSVRLISGGNINGLDLSVDSLIGQFAGAAKTIDLRNDKTLRIDRLVNNSSEPDVVTTIATARGDVIFNNDASKNPEVANLYAKPDLAQEKTGLVNGNYTSGTLNIRSEKGRVRATGNVNSKQPDLVANNISIFSVLGVSTPSRPLVIYSAGTVLYPGTGLNWKPFAAFGQSFNFSSDNALDLSQLLLAAGDQLIEVEPLEDVNPAVFTDVRNYSADSISIMLPADQRYEE